MVINKKYLVLSCVSSLAALIILVNFIFAGHTATLLSGQTSTTIVEDTNTIFNISVNNSGDGDNMTWVNMSLPSSFIFISGTNGTSVAGNFTNLTSVLSWINYTTYLLAANTNNSYFWFTANASTPGRYNISVVAVNQSGGFYASNITITVNDTTIPSSLGISYPSNVSYGANISMLNYTVADNGIDAVSCKVSNNSGVWNSSINAAGTNFTNILSVQGSNTWTIWCNDTGGNVNSTTVTFTQDTVIPSTLTISYPSNTTYGSNISRLNYSVADNIAASFCWVSNNSAVWNSTAVAAGTNFTNIMSIDGTNTWIVWCNDTGGNVNSTNVTFVRDITIPSTLTISYPSNVSYGSNISMLNYSVADNLAISVSCKISNNSGVWNSSINAAGTNFTNILSVQGSNTWTIWCNDTGGNVNSTTVTFTQDTVIPSTLTISYPSNTTYTSNISMLNYSVADNVAASFCWVSNNSAVWNSTAAAVGTNFTNIISVDGTNTWIVWCNDTGGNVNSTNVTFVRDIFYPTITINVPTPSQNISTRLFLINITGVENGGLNYTNVTLINSTGIIVNLTNSSVVNFNTSLAVIRDGNYTLNITSYDRVGNINTTHINITVDTQAPILTISSPANNSLYYVNQIFTLYYTMYDITPDHYWFSNGTNNNVSLNVANLNFSGAGIYNLTLYANDSLNNITSVNITINVTALPATSFLANATVLNVTDNMTNIVVPFNTTLQNASIPITLENRTFYLDFGQLLMSGNVTTGGNRFELIRIGSTYNNTAILSANTNISSNGLWDGKLAFPISNSSAFIAPGGATNIVIDVGPSTSELNFSNAVKLVFGGMSGKSAAWSRGSPTLTNITTRCNSATSPTNIDTTSTRECYIDSGADLIIWTYHFTSFAAFTPSVVTPSSGSSGSGGGSSSGWLTTIAITEDQFTNGYSKDLYAKDRIQFNLDSVSHHVGVVDLTSTTATISVSSAEPQTAVLSIGEEKKFDVNNDGYYDVSVKLNSIISGTKANVLVKRIYERKSVTKAVAPVSQPPAQVTPPPAETPQEEEPTPTETVAEAQGNLLWLWIVLGVVVIAILAVIVYLLTRSNTKKKYTKMYKY